MSKVFNINVVIYIVSPCGGKMPKDFSINISDFSGIFYSMAEKANVNGGKTLDAAEISIFNDMLTTYNEKDKTFIFEQQVYNSAGNVLDFLPNGVEPAVSTRVQKPIDYESADKVQKNSIAIQKAKDFNKKLADEMNKTINIKMMVNGKEVEFSYNRTSIENYIINNSVDSHGNIIKYFSDIPNIRKKAFVMRTHEDNQKLAEFNNMVNSAINAGVEYGVDPKLIIAIVQREVGYQGLSKKVVGVSGKGYMQLTSAPIKDMLGLYTQNGKKMALDTIKTKQYGPELEKLLKGRGFNTDCSPKDRWTLSEKVMSYLKENNDADFNIRLGVLLLRYYLNKSNGNIQLAAQNYNGNSTVKYSYGKAVKNYYSKLSNEQNKA